MFSILGVVIHVDFITLVVDFLTRGFGYRTFIGNMLDLNRQSLFFEGVEELLDDKPVERY